MKSGSFRIRSLIVMLSLVLFVWLATLALALHSVVPLLDEQALRQQIFDVEFIMELAEEQKFCDRDGTPDELNIQRNIDPLFGGESRAFALVCDGGKAVRSEDFPSGVELTAIQDLDAWNPLTESMWAVIVERLPSNDAWFAAASDLEVTDEFVVIFLIENIWLVIPLLLLAVGTVMIGSRFVLNPMGRTVTAIDDRSPAYLAPIEPGGTLDEFRPLIDALNRLLVRMQGAIGLKDSILQHERRFTADAAHELLTPLAAIKSEVEVQQRESVISDDRGAFDRLLLRVDRAAHTVEQLITLSRLDADAVAEQAETVDLVAVLQSVSAVFGDRITHKSLDYELESDGPAIVSGLADHLEIMCRNLIDNAVRYAPDGGSIHARLEQTADDEITLLVENTARPLPRYMKDFIFERFVRRAGERESGSGLGMSIIKRVVDLHGGTISLCAPKKTEGFGVKVTLPGSLQSSIV